MKRVSLVIVASVLFACVATGVPVSDKTVVKAKAEILNASTLNELAFTLIGSEPTTAVGDTENGPKSDILGQASAGIRTYPCLDFPA